MYMYNHYSYNVQNRTCISLPTGWKGTLGCRAVGVQQGGQVGDLYDGVDGFEWVGGYDRMDGYEII